MGRLSTRPGPPQPKKLWLCHILALFVLVNVCFLLYTENTNPFAVINRIVETRQNIVFGGGKGKGLGNWNRGIAMNLQIASSAGYRETVIAGSRHSNMSWVTDLVPEWHHNIYVADDPQAELTVEVNKGNEAMVYLTYLIENYDRLPQFMVFIHGERFQWQNDSPKRDSVSILHSIRLSHLISNGYINLRCTWSTGCPAEMRPKDSLTVQPGEATERQRTEQAWASAYRELFPEHCDVPPVVAVSCCAQFAVTREKVYERSKEDYMRYRQWLVDTTYSDYITGRVFEYMWHIIFGMPPRHCPDERTCYCETYGLLCNNDTPRLARRRVR